MTLLLGLFVLLVGWLAPGHFFPWLSFQNEAAAGAGGLLVGVFACLSARKASVAWPVPALVILGLVLVVAVQFAAGQIRFRSDAVMAAVYLAAFALAIATGATLAHRGNLEGLAPGLFGVLLAAGIASVGIALTQWLELGPLAFIEMIRPGDRPGANLIQANHLATLLCMALVSAWWFYESRRINGGALALAAVWLGVGITMTRSRTSWVFLVLLCVLWLAMRRRVASRLPPKALAAACIGFVGVALAWGPLSHLLAVNQPVTVAERLQGGSTRLWMWQAVGAGLLESPWVGYGWTQVSRAALEGSLAHFSGEFMLRNSHSVLLDLLVWNGIPLGLLVIGLAGWWLVRVLRACRDIHGLLVLLALLAIGVHALFEYPLEYMYFLIPAGLLLGQIDATVAAPSASRRAPVFTLAVPIAALAGMLLWISAEFLRVHEASDANRMVQAGYARSARLPDVWLLDGPTEYIRFWNTQATSGMPDAQLAWMRDVVGRNPSPPALLRMAIAAGLNGKTDEARNTLIRLCNMHNTARCNDGRRSWVAAQSQWEALRDVPFPPNPR